MINNKEYSRLSAYKIAEMVKAKDISAIEVAEAAISRMDATEPFIHAFCTPTRDLAREMAKKIDSQISNGEKVGDLAGVPIGIKDLICTKGIKTASGSNIYKDYIPKCDDIIIERLREAGAVILGKTNVPEFGYSGVGHNPVFPTTRNPWNLDLTSGGSSAGAGASVAAGVTPFSIGSDGGGSIRIPAAHCGLFGIKASFGRVPLWPGTRDHTMPGMSSWEGLEHIGPISRTVKDSAIILSAISGPDMRDQHSLPAANFNWLNCLEGGIRGLRVAYSEDWGYAAVDPKVRKIVRNAVKVFETDLGCEVVEANPGWDDPYEAFWAIVAMETDLSGLRELVSKHAHEMTPHLVDFILKPWTAEDFTDAVIARKAVNNKMSEFMKNFDLLLTPTLACPPFSLNVQGPEKIDDKIVHPFQWLAFTFPINLTRQPAASIPAGFTNDGLPVGLQIIGRHLDDPLVLRAASAFEAASPWSESWPNFLSANAID